MKALHSISPEPLFHCGGVEVLAYFSQSISYAEQEKLMDKVHLAVGDQYFYCECMNLDRMFSVIQQNTNDFVYQCPKCLSGQCS